MLSVRKPFTVKIGTIFKSSHIPLHIWLQAIGLLTASKKGISSNQLHRTLGITLKSAWFLSHRIREAMRSGGLDPLGGVGKIVEADETYFGERENFMPSSNRGGRPYTKGGKSGPSNKRAVLALVERGGETRTFHLDRATKAAVVKIVTDNVAQESYLHTDESRLYGDADQLFAEHHTIKHSVGEYVRGSSTPTPSKASSACSSAAWSASISTAPRSICTATSPSSISGTMPGRRSG